MKHRKTLILGIGNTILTDDSIGPRLADDLKNVISDPDIYFDTASCGGLEIIEQIREFDRVIFIDAIMTTDGVPGEVYYYKPSDFRETSHLSSLHDISFLNALKLGKNLNEEFPHDLHIIAIEIIEDMEFSEDFTPRIRERYPDILNKVSDLVENILAV